MTERQRLAVDKLVGEHEGDPEKLALILCGSLATGKAREDSDVDFYLVVADEAFARVRAARACFAGCWDPAAYFGLETDGKIVSLSFLREAEKRGSEPTRASFRSARALFSRSTEIESLIPRIAVYPERERDGKIRSFLAFVKHYRYVGEAAFRSGDVFHARHCALELVFFAARLALAHNRVLYPCRKGLFAAFEDCADLPPAFIEASKALAAAPGLDACVAYYETVARHYQSYEEPDRARVQVILENEWSWYWSTPPLEES